MSSHTHSLSVLVLLCAAFPAQLFRVVAAMAGGGPARSGRSLWTLWLPGAFVLVALLLWYVAPATGLTRLPSSWLWILVAVLAGVAALVLEVAAAVLPARLRGRRTGGVRLHQGWTDRGALALAGVLVIAAAEEVIFRGIGLYLLAQQLAVPVAVAVAVTALGYGLNHLYFGWSTVGQKTLTGVLYGGLFVASGYSLLVPAVAHLVQNLVVLTVVPRLPSRRAAAAPVRGTAGAPA